MWSTSTFNSALLGSNSDRLAPTPHFRTWCGYLRPGIDWAGWVKFVVSRGQAVRWWWRTTQSSKIHASVTISFCCATSQERINAISWPPTDTQWRFRYVFPPACHAPCQGIDSESDSISHDIYFAHLHCQATSWQNTWFECVLFFLILTLKW